jgi:hypothetical protein
LIAQPTPARSLSESDSQLETISGTHQRSAKHVQASDFGGGVLRVGESPSIEMAVHFSPYPMVSPIALAQGTGMTPAKQLWQ